MTDNVTGMIIAAPTPASTRNAISCVGVPAIDASTFATVNTPNPPSSTGLRPNLSPMAPIGSSKAARAIVYPLITHRSWLCVAPRSTASCCWATFSPDTDAITATRAVHMAIRIIRRCRGSATAVSGAWWRNGGSSTVNTCDMSAPFVNENDLEKSYETVSYY